MRFFVCGFLVGFFLATILMVATQGGKYGDDLREEAVKSGAAYWKVDDKTGKTVFTWKHLETMEKK